MFESLTPAPPDAILGLTEAFKKDPNPKKVNLGQGVFVDANGRTPILKSVKTAEERLLAKESTKSYLPIDGTPEFQAATQQLLFGQQHEVVLSGRAATAQAPGGTGALRIAADFVKKVSPNVTVWIGEPTWPNHPSIFKAAGLQVKSYNYFDASSNGVDFPSMLQAISSANTGDVILLHGSCHNPTGIDLNAEQWQQVSSVIAQRGLLPLVDFAYQGFADGLSEDAQGLYTLIKQGGDMLISSSYSKNFGLYNERVGALTVIGKDRTAAESAMSHVKQAIRANFSNPPAHGGQIVTMVLSDPALRAQWEGEVTEMRDRINTMRHLFVETLNEKGVERDFSYIARQRGMFSFSGLNPDQVKALRDKYAIYIVGSGRINVAGMTETNMDYLCSAIADVLKG
ncbi:MAG: amino acid aminotransferase [Caldilineaceae bacterium]